MGDRLEIAYHLLDAQIIDVEGRRCGRVDDVELAGAPGEPLRLTALLTGHGLYPQRLPRRLQGLGRRIFGPGVLGRTVRRVPWTAVDHVDTRVVLREKAAELGLGTLDRDLQPWFEKVPRG
jgi:hypothetical protein